MKLHWTVILKAAALLPALVLYSVTARAEVSDEDVAKCIETLKNAIIANQNSWSHDAGTAALAVLALKQAGVPNSHPSIVEGVKFIASNADETHLTYGEGLVACALELVDSKKYQKRIKTAAANLISIQRSLGAWGYNGQNPAYYDNSNSQFAILGLAAAERCGITIPAAVKARALKHWKQNQGEDGSWDYNGRSKMGRLSMSLAGLSSMFLLGEQLEKPQETCGKYEYSRNFAIGLKYTEGKLTGVQNDYTLYALERVGIYLGLSKIGEIDWYRYGAEIIVNQYGKLQPQDFNPNHAFALLFLAKGRIPIAIAKWQWNGDWNNDHGDAQAWVSVAGKELDRKLDWLPARLDGLDSSAAKASIVFVNGHKAFEAGDAEIDFLRKFLEKGGTLIAENCCGKTEFGASFREIMATRLFPGRKGKFEKIKADHPLLSTVYKIKASEAGVEELRVGCATHKRVILLTSDISCTLNGENKAGDKSRQSSASKLAVNLMAWALLSKKPLQKLEKPEPVKEVAGDKLVEDVKRSAAKKGNTFNQPLVRVDHQGDDMADQLFEEKLSKAMAGRPDLPKFDGTFCAAASSEDIFNAAVLFMTGHDDPAIDEKGRANLRRYIENGGFLLAGDCCGEKGFDDGFRRMIKQMFPNDNLEKIPAADSIWKMPFDCLANPAKGTKAYSKAFNTEWAPLYGLKREGRWVVVYSPTDFCCCFDHEMDQEIPAYEMESSIRLLSDIMTYALTPR